MRIVGYPRVSTEEQDFDLQITRLEAYAAYKGHELVEMVKLDEGDSGKSLDRPGFNRVRELLDSGAAEGVAVYRLDRLTRNMEDWCFLTKNYFGETAGHTLISLQEEVNTSTAMGRMTLKLFVMVAEWERETLVERTRDKLRFKKAMNERTGSIPYGKSLVDDGRRSKPKKDKNGRSYGDGPICLVPNPHEEEAILLIHQLRATWMPLRAIAAELDRRGFATKGGKPWRHTSVQAILQRKA